MRSAILGVEMLCPHRIKPEALDERRRTCNLGIIGRTRCDTQAGATLSRYRNSRSRPARIERMANPNPSPATRFGAGQPTNNGGKTSEQRRLDYETAEMAARIRNKLISVIMEKMDGDADALELMSGDVLRLLKDSEDRAHGTPKQSVEHSGDPDRPLTIIERRIVKADD